MEASGRCFSRCFASLNKPAHGTISLGPRTQIVKDEVVLQKSPVAITFADQCVGISEDN